MELPIEEILFEAARNLGTAGEREALLDFACRLEPELRSRLDELLSFQPTAETFFEFPPEIAAPEADGGKPFQEEIGAHIGRYRLITLLGSGGCGSVYLAQQEEPVRRKVALKIIRFGMDTAGVIVRFDLERQALAQMNHPSISRVLDGGATGSGRPFFVMELVEGEKITEFCDANRFTIRQRVELCVQICRAIQHAHQKGIIHRDIKPSNILIGWHDGAPVPKVIDFGIAKATEHSTLEEPGIAGSDRFLGTPAYMSPEQARNSADLDTRADIYSLGVLLYELLCSRVPLNLDHVSHVATDEIRRAIEEDVPLAPSAAVAALAPEERNRVAANRGTSASRLISHLAEDLDAIVLKTLNKDRSERYDTATGLAMELVRYLNNEVILARPPRRLDRLKKLIQRNKLAFVAICVAFLGLIVAFCTSTHMLLEEKAGRHRAELQELVERAAVKVKYDELAAADEILARVPGEQTPASPEAAEAFGAVGEWHASAGRFREASARYRSMMQAVASIDEADLFSVSQNLQPVAATVAYADGAAAYESVRQTEIRRFANASNPIVAEHVLKACLLLPTDSNTLRALAPLADLLQKNIKSGYLKDFPDANGWGMFALALMNYRAGNYTVAADWARQSLAATNENKARTVTTWIVMAMIQKKLGRPAEARTALEEGREPLQEAYDNGDWIRNNSPVFRFDWTSAELLLNEAERLLEGK